MDTVASAEICMKFHELKCVPISGVPIQLCRKAFFSVGKNVKNLVYFWSLADVLKFMSIFFHMSSRPNESHVIIHPWKLLNEARMVQLRPYNTWIVCYIALTACNKTFCTQTFMQLLQISTATPPERTFSAMKILKTWAYLRSMITDENMQGLAMAYIHRDITIDVDRESINLR